MDNWFLENIVSIVSGIIATFFAALALKYQKKSHRLEVEKVISTEGKIKIFFSRNSMVKYLLEMYSRASDGDVIWGQCQSCSNYTEKVRYQVSSAASRGVKFKIILNEKSEKSKELAALYESLKNSEIAYRSDNSIKIQGLSSSEIVLSFSTLDSYIAIAVKDSEIVSIFLSWFMKRLDSAKKKI